MPLKRKNAGSPLVTNAACNRRAAEKAFAAGVTIHQIAAFWPAVWKLTNENGRVCLSQRYDYELNDGSGRSETNRRITDSSVADCIAKYRAANLGKCELCGESAGEGGAVCPACVANHGLNKGNR